LTFKKLPFTALLRNVFRRSQWIESKDSTPWDCTFQAAGERDVGYWEAAAAAVAKSLSCDATSAGVGAGAGRTWFRSYAAVMVRVQRMRRMSGFLPLPLLTLLISG
jgi:hypothetical protein